MRQLHFQVLPGEASKLIYETATMQPVFDRPKNGGAAFCMNCETYQNWDPEGKRFILNDHERF